MPADPILAAASGNLSPAAPGLTTGADGGDLAPAAPAALLPAAGGTGGALLITGSTTPATAGEYPAVGETLQSPTGTTITAYPGSTQQWSVDGSAVKPSSGPWAAVYKASVSAPAATTVDALAPKAAHNAGATSSTSTSINVFHDGLWKLYWLFSNSGDPYWIKSGVDSTIHQDATVIPAGAWCFPDVSDGGFLGGLGLQWQNEGHFIWVMALFNNGTSTKTWLGTGTHPATATWAPFGTSTGIPGVALGSGSAADTPESIVAEIPLPTTPGQTAGAIIANLTPAAPAQKVPADPLPTTPGQTAGAITSNLSPAAPGAIVP